MARCHFCTQQGDYGSVPQHHFSPIYHFTSPPDKISISLLIYSVHITIYKIKNTSLLNFINISFYKTSEKTKP